MWDPLLSSEMRKTRTQLLNTGIFPADGTRLGGFGGREMRGGARLRVGRSLAKSSPLPSPAGTQHLLPGACIYSFPFSRTSRTHASQPSPSTTTRSRAGTSRGSYLVSLCHGDQQASGNSELIHMVPCGFRALQATLLWEISQLDARCF